jgi:hypothetical protein
MAEPSRWAIEGGEWVAGGYAWNLFYVRIPMDEFQRLDVSGEWSMNCRFLQVAAHPEVRQLKEAAIHPKRS